MGRADGVLTRLHYDQARRLASLAEQDADLSGLLASPVLRSREEWDLSPEDTLPQRRRIEHGHHHPIHAVTNQLHQVTTLTHPARGTAHYHWTPDGALASRTGPDGQLLLTHDWRDRLIRAQLPDGRTIDELLDPLGRLTARLRSDGHATVYLSDGDQVVEEYAVPPGGTTPLLQRRMVWGRWIDDLLAVIRDTDGDGVPDSTLFPLTDLLGSVEVLADAAGAIVEGVRSRPDGTPEAFAPALPAPAELAWTGDGETSAGHLPPNQLTLTFTAPLGEDLSRLAVELDGVPHGGTAALSPHGRTLVLSDLTLPATTTLRLGGLADRAGRALPPVEASVTLTDPQRYTVLATWEEPKVQAVLESQAGVTVVATVPVTGDELQGAITVTLNGQPLSGTVSRVAPEALHWSASDEAWQTGAEVTVSLHGLTDLSEPARPVMAGPWSFTVLAGPEAMLVAEDGGAVESRTASAFGVTAYFQGRMWDSDLGMYHYRARWYDPELVNFIQRDPLGYVDSSNLYQALGYNPYRYVDPLGLATVGGLEEKRGREAEFLSRSFRFYLGLNAEEWLRGQNWGRWQSAKYKDRVVRQESLRYFQSPYGGKRVREAFWVPGDYDPGPPIIAAIGSDWIANTFIGAVGMAHAGFGRGFPLIFGHFSNPWPSREEVEQNRAIQRVRMAQINLQVHFLNAIGREARKEKGGSLSWGDEYVNQSVQVATRSVIENLGRFGLQGKAKNRVVNELIRALVVNSPSFGSRRRVAATIAYVGQEVFGDPEAISIEADWSPVGFIRYNRHFVRHKMTLWYGGKYWFVSHYDER